MVVEGREDANAWQHCRTPDVLLNLYHKVSYLTFRYLITLFSICRKLYFAACRIKEDSWDSTTVAAYGTQDFKVETSRIG